MKNLLQLPGLYLGDDRGRTSTAERGGTVLPATPYGAAKAYSYWITGNFRKACDMFAVNGIPFNHESPVAASVAESEASTPRSLVCTLHGLPMGWTLTGGKPANATSPPPFWPRSEPASIRDYVEG